MSRLKDHDISRRLVANIPDELADLLEVASYVYAADSAVLTRWHDRRTDGRAVAAKVQVRGPGPPTRTSGPRIAISSALIETLSFLSDDEYDFEFRPSVQPAPLERLFRIYGGEEGLGISPDEVILFSGGLDSFAGTVEELVARESPSPWSAIGRRARSSGRRSISSVDCVSV